MHAVCQPIEGIHTIWAGYAEQNTVTRPGLPLTTPPGGNTTTAWPPLAVVTLALVMGDGP
jgi:hypothetical protein